MEVVIDNRNPVIRVLEMTLNGDKMEPVDMPKCECKWYFNEDGEYVRDDG